MMQISQFGRLLGVDVLHYFYFQTFCFIFCISFILCIHAR